MTVTQTRPGSLKTTAVGHRWILVFGGVTRQGNRRGRRAVAQALESGIDVVWFDGFEEEYPESGERVPVDATNSDARLAVVECREMDDLTLPGRMRVGGPLLRNPVTRILWKLVLRRLGTLFRPRAWWKVVRRDVKALASGSTPDYIVYCDDFAVTSAWYAGRAWPYTPIVAHLPGGDD